MAEARSRLNRSTSSAAVPAVDEGIPTEDCSAEDATAAAAEEDASAAEEDATAAEDILLDQLSER